MHVNKIVFLGLLVCAAPALAATATPVPAISAAPSSLNLGNVALGSSSAATPVTVKNTGKSNLTVSSVAISEATGEEFSQTNNCTTVQPGSSCTVNVTFTPALPYAKKAAVLTLSSNDPKKPSLNVKLSANVPPPAVSVTPASINFGKLPSGTTTSSKTVAIKNSGLSPLDISSVTVGGSNPGDFGVTGECATVINGESCTLTVNFTPAAAGSRSASMVISSNDPKKSSLTVKLSGSSTGTTPGGGGSGGDFTTCAEAGLSTAGGNLCLAKSSTALAVNGLLTGVAYGNGLWVTVGSNGTIATSSDAATWTKRTSGTTSDLKSITYANGLWVVAGDLPGIALYSTDGIHWTSASGIATSDALFSVAYGNGQWIATGSANSNEMSYSSSDGKTWVKASSSLTYQDRPFSAIAFAPTWATFNNGLWIGGSSEGLVSSTDGVHWSIWFAGNVFGSPVAAAFGKGEWVELESTGGAISSTGQAWTPVAVPTTGSPLYHALTFANNMWVGAGATNGIVITSSNGSTWQIVRTDTSGYIQTLSGVAFGNNRWVIVGGGGTTAAGVILVSTTATVSAQ